MQFLKKKGEFMNKLTLQFHDYIYFKHTNSEILLYDTINNQTFVFNIAEQKYILDQDIMMIEPVDDEIKRFLKIISEKHLCAISDFACKKKYFFNHGYNVRLNRWGKYINTQIDNNFIANNYVNVLTIFIDSFYEPFTFEPTKSLVTNTISITLLEFLFQKGYFNNLTRVELVGKLASFIYIENILNQLSKRVNIEIFIPIHEFDEYRCSQLKKIKISVSLISDGYSSNIVMPLKNKDINILLIINKKNDISQLKENGLLSNSRIICRFSNKCSVKFLKKYLSYTIKDVFEKPISITKAIINELCNELYWGKLTINIDGDMLSYPHIKIGHIGNMQQANFGALLSDESLWLKIRKKNSKCISCCYNCLCPPLTLIELLSKQVFCEHKIHQYAY